jgi:5-methyltetrahydrofolate--homocysteine methyltransferase
MVKFLNLIAAEPDICRVPIMLDSSKWSVLEKPAAVPAGQGHRQLDLAQGRRGRVPAPRPAAPPLRRGRGGDGLRRAGPGRHARREGPHLHARLPPADGAGRLSAEDIIFDPNILTVATGIEEHNNYAVDFFEATRIIKETLPHAKVSGGVSNVSFSFRGNNPVREAMHTAFLYHAIRAGHGHGDRQRRHARRLRGDPRICANASRMCSSTAGPDATERLITFAERSRPLPAGGRRAKSRRTSPGATAPVEERLKHALVKGIDAFVEADTEEAGRSTRARSTSSRARSWTACAWSATCSAPARCFSPRS